MGRVRLKGIPPQFWPWAVSVLALFGVVYWRISEGQLERAKAAVMAKQRAVAQSLGPKLVPFAERAETWARELGGNWTGDKLPAADLPDTISTSPGVYLRLRQNAALDSATVRRGATKSLRDGFTACLFVRNAGTATEADGETRCMASADCKPGFVCGETGSCARPGRPYNMRLAYRALRVLSTDWTDELHEAGSDLAVKAYERDLDSVVKTDIPVAIELLVAAKFLTIVLDEDPETGLPEVNPDVAETDEERVQRSEHWARVGIWNLQDNKPLLQVRRRVKGELAPVGERVLRNPEIVAAQQRQANSCALALQVKALLPTE